jgi:hypothetical protein
VARMGTGEVHTGFWWGDIMERGHLEDLGVDGSASRMGGMNCFDLAQDSDRRRAVVNAVIILRVQ